MTADVEREELFAKLTAERDELQQQILRTIADMQNMRKRYQQEAMQIRQFATEELVRELLPILDNFERTIAAGDQGADVKTVMEGIQAVDRQLRSALERQKVTRIQSHGNPFDPDIHEAIATDDSDEHPEGTVTLEIEPGYKMADKVIRPARVRVSKKP
jgi:molecular chaperone GrpE